MEILWTLAAGSILLIMYLSAENRIRSSSGADQSMAAQDAGSNVFVNIALFVLLLALASCTLLFATVATQFIVLSPFIFPMYLAYIAFFAGIQSSMLQTRFPSHRWYNRFWPTFLLDCVVSLPLAIF